MSKSDRKVLIVDNEAKVRRLLVATLTGGPFEILEARDGDQGLAMARREQPDVILLDVLMPGIDGLEVCRQIKADSRLKGSLVVMLTAHVQESVRRQAIQAGADLFLTKPFSPRALKSAIERQSA